jgi:glyoxylase-like metal-dependent hydrolase (beta-lactamase superfamily II)
MEGTLIAAAFKDVVVLRPGDAEGNGMVVRLTTSQGKDIHAIAVPQDWPSRTGPTWAYLFENEGLTLIDAGAVGSFPSLVDGIQQARFSVRDIDRVVVTHGHQDHDGAAGQLAEEAGVEIWAHDIYAHLLPYDPWEIQRGPTSQIQEEMFRVARNDSERTSADGPRNSSGYRNRHQAYVGLRRKYNVSHRISSGETLGGLSFMHAPGHTPDEIYATLDGLDSTGSPQVVFTGDHVLPEITPHPTTKTRYSKDIKRLLPAEYHHEDSFYGLATYLRSLKKVVDLGPEVVVLPAHRLFSKNRFNLQTTHRAGEIIQHHAQRLGRILHRLGQQPASLEEITRGIFARRKLIGGNLYAALSEVVAHVELLQDTGDLEVTEGGRLRCTGSENYKRLVDELTACDWQTRSGHF